MAILEVPVDSVTPSYRLSVELENVQYTFRVRYNTRAKRWYADLYDSDGNIVEGSRKLLVNYPLYPQLKYDSRIPPGDLMCFDTSNSAVPAALDDLGDRVVMLYKESTT